MRVSILLSLVSLLVADVSFACGHLGAQDQAPPTPGVVNPPLTSDAVNPNCGPIGYSRTDRDYAPGRAQRVTGGMLLGLGLLTAVPGAAMLGWAQTYDPLNDRPVDNLRQIRNAGAVATAIGAASVVIGIPVLAVGVHKGHKARNERVTMVPSLAPTLGGAQAGLGGTF